MAWPYHPELLAKAVPRYTSYPTAAEFGPAVGPGDMAGALRAIAPGTGVSLYLHIPFCRAICWYCGCNTGAANRAQRLTHYLDLLEAEIALIADMLPPDVSVARVAFGGGSPNAIAAEQFDSLVAAVRRGFDCRDAVLSVEIDPRCFDSGWADALRRGGVTRASLGVQTLSPTIQAAIGRVQPAAMIADAIAQLRASGITSINLDLMYGLPGQDRATLADTITGCLAHRPERLAVFGYAHVPAILPRQRRIDASALPDGAERFAQAELAHAMLTGRGYDVIGFDHFALPGDAIAQAARGGRLRRNFQGFTEDGSDVLIGLGASAISCFPDRLLQNEKNSGRWGMMIAAGRSAVTRGVSRTPADRQRARAIERLLCAGSADLGGLDTPGVRAALQPFVARDLCHWAGSTLACAPHALPYRRSIATALDPYRGASAGSFSHAI